MCGVYNTSKIPPNKNMAFYEHGSSSGDIKNQRGVVEIKVTFYEDTTTQYYMPYIAILEFKNSMS